MTRIFFLMAILILSTFLFSWVSFPADEKVNSNAVDEEPDHSIIDTVRARKNLYWTPSIGPGGMAFVKGNRYKAWEGNVLTGSLRFKYLNLSRFNGTKPTGEEMLLKNIGRLREVKMGPDRYIYVSVEEPGYVFRLIPVKK